VILVIFNFKRIPSVHMNCLNRKDCMMALLLCLPVLNFVNMSVSYCESVFGSHQTPKQEDHHLHPTPKILANSLLAVCCYSDCYTSYLSSGDRAIGQTVANVPSGLSLTPPPKKPTTDSVYLQTPSISSGTQPLLQPEGTCMP
jgi:hypothetical protein